MITPNRILIIKPSSLGDVATTLPMLCDLRRALPAATIDWLIAPAFAALVKGHDALNNVIIFDRKQLASWWRSPAAFRKFRELKRALKSGHYDWVIDAQGLLRSGYFSKITGAKLRVGFADAREGGSFFYTHKVPIRRADAMSVIRMRSLLDPLEIPHDGPVEYRVPIDADAQKKMSGIVPANAIGFIPGCRGEGKRWPSDAFAYVISALSENHSCVLLGAPDERELCEHIAIRSGTNGRPRVNVAGQTSIADMVAGLARCRLIVGNDTGPLHVGVALGKPIIGLYGRTDPKSVGPYGQLENVVRFTDKPMETASREVLALADKLLAAKAFAST